MTTKPSKEKIKTAKRGIIFESVFFFVPLFCHLQQRLLSIEVQ